MEMTLKPVAFFGYRENNFCQLKQLWFTVSLWKQLAFLIANLPFYLKENPGVLKLWADDYSKLGGKQNIILKSINKKLVSQYSIPKASCFHSTSFSGRQKVELSGKREPKLRECFHQITFGLGCEKRFL